MHAAQPPIKRNGEVTRSQSPTTLSHTTMSRYYPAGNRRHHIEILLLVLITTYLLSSAYHFASAYKIFSKSNHQRQCCDVISILKLAASSHKSSSGFNFSEVLA